MPAGEIARGSTRYRAAGSRARARSPALHHDDVGTLCSPRSTAPALPFCEVLGNLLDASRVEDVLRGEAGFACDPGAADRVRHLGDGMRIGIDAEDHAVFDGAADVAPVEVEPV